MADNEALTDAEQKELTDYRACLHKMVSEDLTTAWLWHDEALRRLGSESESADEETSAVLGYMVADHRRRRDACSAEIGRRRKAGTLPTGQAVTAITPELINEIKGRVSLSDIAEGYGLALKRRGKSLVALCPFHQEKTPSFTIFPDGHYHCFGCKASGDVIAFVMRTNNTDFITALRDVATVAGIALPRRNSKQRTKNISTPEEEKPLVVITADTILKTAWPDPVWAIPKHLPVGLAILGGAPKLGKSWLALQIALAVGAGGIALGEHVQKGPVLYLALEDTARRLQDRMKRQGWVAGLPVEFLIIGQFETQIGDLKNGGGHKLANQIERCGYRLVVIDTLSRSVYGDQNDAEQMTRGLRPIHEIANLKNTAVLLIDHHRKSSGENPDAIADILGSTAKGAMADTIWGLYRERGKHGAKLAITGREVEEQTLALTMDFATGVWQLDGNADTIELTERRREILDALADLGRPSQLNEISKMIGQPRSNTYTRLQDLVAAGKLNRSTGSGKVFYQCVDP